MAERYEDFDRNRQQDRDRDQERHRESGQRGEDYRRDWRVEDSSRGGRDYSREREYGRERGHGREGGYATQSPETERGWREDWRGRERGGESGLGFGGGLGNYSERDWRTERTGPWGGGMGEGFRRGQESWEGGSGYGQRGGAASEQSTWRHSGYGGETYRGGSAGWSGGQGLYGQETTGRFIGRGPKGYQRSDERIREEVCERLTQHPDVDASDIEIQVNNGEVTLTGSVDDRHQKRTAEDAIENLSGVNEVHNQLRISKGVMQRMGEALGMKDDRDKEDTISSTGRQFEPTTTRR